MLSWFKKLFSKKDAGERLIPVLPKNYRSIALKAIEVAVDPKVYIDKKETSDFSEQGLLTQSGIRRCIDFEIKDGDQPILGFHDHPSQMWISESYAELAQLYESSGWLKIEGPAN